MLSQPMQRRWSKKWLCNLRTAKNCFGFKQMAHENGNTYMLPCTKLAFLQRAVDGDIDKSVVPFSLPS